jgi:hypothetical protein
MRHPWTHHGDNAGWLASRPGGPGGGRLSWPVALPVLAVLAALTWLIVLALLRLVR